MADHLDPKDCTHEEFAATVNVNRFEDSGKFSAEIRITCVRCQEPMRFLGVSAGVNFDSPTVSIDGLELHAPIEPEIEKQLHATASYVMPQIPVRH